ncbi:unnamed protein product, partial [Pylaiella littoralis]
ECGSCSLWWKEAAASVNVALLLLGLHLPQVQLRHVRDRRTRKQSLPLVEHLPSDAANVLVMPHAGQLVSDFYDGLFLGSHFDSFSHGAAGHLDVRKICVFFKHRVQILLRQRDSRFRESRTLLFCV